MTKLLVSVRNATEAIDALNAGADLIDVKEPKHGSLGRASTQVLNDVAAAVAGRVPISAALGEIGEDIEASALQALCHFNFAKIGLTQAVSCSNWRATWREVVNRLPPGVASVAVIYADGDSYNAPPTESILREAVKLGCAGVLLDTFAKDGRNLFEHWPVSAVGELLAFTREHQMFGVLAGALKGKALLQAAALEPDYVAVRSAVCRGARTDSLSAELVARLATQLGSSTDAVGTTNPGKERV